jgi:peptidoglycan hydrolase-like protein with peptidoglycan-binding domain
MQRRLTALGFDTGGIDGRVGPMTRKAIKTFQASVYLPADGYPSMGLLERLRGN